MAGWKKRFIEPNRILWTKGNFKEGEGYPDWIHVDDIGNEFEVGAKRKINPETINGHFKFFKKKSEAMKFAKSYIRSH